MKFKHNVTAMWSYIAIKNIAKKTTIASAIACGAGSLGLLPAAMAQAAKPAIGKEADRNLQVTAAPAAAFPGQSAGKRVALVIGNSSYKDSPLLNPVNDARAISAALKESGFSVIAKENIDQRGMLSALREFGDKLRDGGVGIFYYAGHGMQIKGRNYLIPVGASIEREDEVAYSAVDAQAVLDKMEAAGNGTNIMILDACRNNPFTRSTRSGQAGLAQMDAPVGTLVAFATSPGAVASDGGGQNGLYTQHLLTAMRQQGAKVEDVFKQVRTNVRRDSQGKQVPWESTSLEGDFYFKVPSGLVTSSAAKTAASVDSPAAIDQRTQELLQELALAKPMPTPASTTAGKPPRKTNSFGYTVGDRWRYQTVDRYKSEVTGNWSRQVDKFDAQGGITMRGGNVRWAADGSWRYQRDADGGTLEYSDNFKMVPATLKAGHSEKEKFTLTWNNNGGNGQEERAGEVKVVGLEKIKVPAGEFEAWKIERKGFVTGKNLSASTVYNQSYTMVQWYVPALRAYAAEDYERRDSRGNIDRYTRQELTSFEVVGVQSLAQR